MRPFRHPRFRNWLSRIATGALGAGALALATSMLVTSSSDARVPRPERRMTVTMAEATAASPTRTLRFSGQLRPRRSAMLAFTVAGRVVERWVDQGDDVRAGQSLVRLDDRALQRQVDALSAMRSRAVAELDNQVRARDRAEQLHRAQAIGTAQRDDALTQARTSQAARERAEAELARAERTVAETRLRAPFDGRVARVHLEVGEFASPGAPALELVDEGSLELEVEVPETVLPRLQEGGEATIALPMLGETVRGRVTSVGTVPEGAALFPVLLVIEASPELRAGTTAELVLSEPLGTGVAVPVEAVVDRSGQSPRVFVVRDGVAVVVAVRILAVAADEVIVAGDLTPGDAVVTGGHSSLVEGATVESSR